MKALFIGVHIDDCEAYGDIAHLLIEKGVEVTFLNLKHYRHFEGPNPEVNAKSMKLAEILGAKKIILDYDGPKYFKATDEITRAAEQVIRDEKPDIMFIQHPQDNHIEHIESAKVARDAIFAASVDGVFPNEIYSYECGAKQTMAFFKPDFYINVSDCLDIMEACHAPLNINHANGANLTRRNKIAAQYRGMACDFDYAKGLKIIKYPNRNNDFLLKQLLNDRWCWAGDNMYYPGSELFFNL